MTHTVDSSVSIEPCSSTGFGPDYLQHVLLPPFQHPHRSNITVATWIRAARVDNDQPLVTLTSQQNSASISFIFSAKKVGLTWRASSLGNVSYTISTINVLQLLKWVHVTLVASQSSFKIYVGGYLVDELQVETGLPFLVMTVRYGIKTLLGEQPKVCLMVHLI